MNIEACEGVQQTEMLFTQDALDPIRLLNSLGLDCKKDTSCNRNRPKSAKFVDEECCKFGPLIVELDG